MRKVLVVDDNKDTLKYMKAFFEDRKFEVILLRHGHEAVSTIKSQEIGIVILDINLEDSNGIEILKKIKEYDPKILVIVVTGLKDKETKKLAAEHGADGFLNKPLAPNRLEGIVSINLSKIDHKGGGHGARKHPNR